MNIFVTSDSPIVSASNLDQKRLVKMILETGQLLSTAVRVNGADHIALYKVAYLNHPCSRWARSTQGNFLWLSVHGLAMCDLYRKNYGRQHKTEDVIRKCLDYFSLIPEGKLEAFVNCALDKNTTDVIQAYRDTMNLKWHLDKNPPVWLNRDKPSWYVNLG